MLYRPYIPADFDSLYALEERCFELPHRFSRRYMRSLVNRATAATWIAEEDGALAGFAIVEWSRRRGGISAYIQTIEVAPEQRGHGVGSELLCRVEGSARTAQAVTIWLHVDAQNLQAIRLYEAHGYGCAGREEDYYASGRAGLLYAKRLNTESPAN